MFIGSEGIAGRDHRGLDAAAGPPALPRLGGGPLRRLPRGAAAVRALSQSGLFPSNCRLIDAQEAAGAGAGERDGEGALLVLGFESADHPVEPWMERALELARDHGGTVHVPEGGAGHREGAAGAWRDAFIRAPYLREVMVPLGVIADTFETAITWDRFEALHAGIVERMGAVLREVTGRPGTITCRFTHVYPDGPAPYFTFQALGAWDGLLEQWRQIKVAANEAVVALGGTITHHHAVGRDHRPGWERQRPPLFAEALRAAKGALDPRGILNPGVLIDPRDRPVGVTGALGSDVLSSTSPPS
jgi:alkyldihydroxyacetonephosphate synthase